VNVVLVVEVLTQYAFLATNATDVASAHEENDQQIVPRDALEEVTTQEQEVRRIERVTHEGVGSSSFDSSISGGEAERSTQGREGREAVHQTEELDVESRDHPPVRMCASGSKEKSTTSPAEGQEPVDGVGAECSGASANEIGDHHPELLGEEHRADERMRSMVVLVARRGEESGAARADQIRQRPRRVG
jgi:hypothetical protein